jgi:hypothetical protein
MKVQDLDEPMMLPTHEVPVSQFDHHLYVPLKVHDNHSLRVPGVTCQIVNDQEPLVAANAQHSVILCQVPRQRMSMFDGYLSSSSCFCIEDDHYRITLRGKIYNLLILLLKQKGDIRPGVKFNKTLLFNMSSYVFLKINTFNKS